jgi:hypothetical protein
VLFFFRNRSALPHVSSCLSRKTSPQRHRDTKRSTENRAGTIALKRRCSERMQPQPVETRSISDRLPREYVGPPESHVCLSSSGSLLLQVLSINFYHRTGAYSSSNAKPERCIKTRNIVCMSSGLESCAAQPSQGKGFSPSRHESTTTF